MIKNIKVKDFEIILNSTGTGTVINVKYTATYIDELRRKIISEKTKSGIRYKKNK